MTFIAGWTPFELILENELLFSLLKRQHIMAWEDIDTFGKEIKKNYVIVSDI